jgi:putative salt-induced outer membrane protein YdiY
MKTLTTQLSIAVCAALAAGAVQAQTTLKTDGNWRGSIGAGYSATSGNTKSSSLTCIIHENREWKCRALDFRVTQG